MMAAVIIDDYEEKEYPIYGCEVKNSQGGRYGTTLEETTQPHCKRRVSDDHAQCLVKRAKRGMETFSDNMDEDEENDSSVPCTPPSRVGYLNSRPVTKSASPHHKPNVSLSVEGLRKRIRGKRIARSLAGCEPGTPSFCFGKVISIIAGACIDDDIYRVAYDDGGVEDLNSLLLFGMNLLSCSDLVDICEFVFLTVTIYTLWSPDALLLYVKKIPVHPVHTTPYMQDITENLYIHSPRVQEFKLMLLEQEKINIRTIRVTKKHNNRGNQESNERVFGSVVGIRKMEDCSFCPVVWKVQYDNGEKVEIGTDELKTAAILYQMYQDEDPTPVQVEHYNNHTMHDYPKYVMDVAV